MPGVRGHIDGDGDYVVKLNDIIADIRQYRDQVAVAGGGSTAEYALNLLASHYEAKALEMHIAISDEKVQALGKERIQCSAKTDDGGPEVSV